MEFIDLKTQYCRYQREINARMNAVLQHGHFIMGPEIAELEAALAAYVGVPHAITVASGTVSLEIALRALGIGPGDEVITVPFTWISSSEVILAVGARPVFVDIEIDSFNIDVSKIESAITPRTKALIPVSLFGQMPDYDRINAIAARHNIAVIEDGAQSFGATRNGKRSCGVTRVGSTSFFPAKPLGCYGDGGALFTADAELADRMRAIRTHGGLKRHYHTLVGMNARLDTLQAAILLAKWPHFEAEVAARGRIGARYTELFLARGQRPEGRGQRAEGRGQRSGTTHHSPPTTPHSPLTTPAVMPGNTHVYAQYTIRVPNRDAVAEKLKVAGIPTVVYYPKCLHEQPVFAPCGYKYGDFPESERASREVLSLPMHPFLNEQDQDRIVQTVIGSLN